MDQQQPRETTGAEIAVIGMAGRFPGAAGVAELWRNLVAGVEGIRRFTPDELRAAGVPDAVLADPAYVPAGGWLAEADHFDAAFFRYTPREAEITDPQHRLFLECAWTALEDAGYAPSNLQVPAGVYAGVSQSAYWFENLLPNRAVMAGGAVYDVCITRLHPAPGELCDARVSQTQFAHLPGITLPAVVGKRVVLLDRHLVHDHLPGRRRGLDRAGERRVLARAEHRPGRVGVSAGGVLGGIISSTATTVSPLTLAGYILG